MGFNTKCEVWITDLECCVELIQKNIVHNIPMELESTVIVRGCAFDWGRCPREQGLLADGYDVCIFSECIYLEDLFEMLLASLLKVHTPKNIPYHALKPWLCPMCWD